MVIEQLEIGYMDNFCYIVGCKKTRKALVIDPGHGGNLPCPGTGRVDHAGRFNLLAAYQCHATDATAALLHCPYGCVEPHLDTRRAAGFQQILGSIDRVHVAAIQLHVVAQCDHLLARCDDERWIAQDAVEAFAGDGLEAYLETSHRLALKVLENDERRDRQLLDQPSRLRIRTIESLCIDLARQLPIVSGLGAGQQESDDDYGRTVKRIELAAYLYEITGDPQWLQAGMGLAGQIVEPAHGTKPQPSVEDWMQHAVERMEEELVSRYGEDQAPRIRRGLAQVASFWRTEDGGPEIFENFTRINFAGDQQTLDRMFGRFQFLLGDWLGLLG